MPNWKKVITSGSDAVLTSVTATAGFTGSLLGTASYAINAATASYVSSNFQYEIHVSQIDGNDTTGNGDLLKPVATIGKALLLVSASVASTDRRTIIVHPGTYIENITVNTTNTYFFSTGLLGANCLISGSVTVSAATRMSGLKMTNLIVSSSAPVYINNCAVDKQMTVSGSGYLEVQNTSLQCTSGIQVVGPASSGVIFENCLLYPLTVNNASAAVYIISCNQAITPTLTAGALTITRSTISSLTSGATSTALTTAAGSVLVLESCNVYNSLLTSHAAITANGFYSIKNVIYNKPASTLASLSGTGGPLATISQFQYINADNITTSGLTVTGSLNITGSTTQIGNINLTGSLNVAGSVINNLTASYATQALSASYAPGGGAAFPFNGNAQISGSFGVTGSLFVQDFGKTNIDSSTRQLYDAGPVMPPGAPSVISVDWGSRTLVRSDGNTSVDWQNRQLKDSTGTEILNWQQGVSITGSTITSGSFTSYGSFIVTDQMGMPSADLGVARILRDSNGVRAVNYRDRFLQDVNDVTAVDWRVRKLFDKYATASINWDTRVLTDSTEVPALDWNARQGYKGSPLGSVTTLDWNSMALSDNGGTLAVDWRNRNLLDGTGTSRLNWMNGAAPSQILIDAYSTNNISLTTEAEPLANYPNYGNAFTPAGEIINGVTFAVGVSDYDLVSLDATGQWYQTAMNSNLSTKMLGIAFNVGGANSVLLEGHMVVSSGSNGAPKVSNLTIGSAVYMNTTSSGIFMSNTAPVATGQAVRLLGHVYYNSTNDATWYLMKFRPSNDWVTL